MVNYKLLIGLFLILSSCNCDDAEMTLARMDYSGNEIRIDGYYYHQVNDVFNSFLLFGNGVYHDLGQTNQSSLESLDLLIQDETFYKNLEDIQYTWGVFKVVNNTIEIERWLPGSGGPYPVQMLEGEVIDDETILISGLRGTKYEDEIDEFKFRHLSPKPDSTNAFIP